MFLWGVCSSPDKVDREKVLSHGKEVVGKLLVELQVRKSTADGPGARQFYTQLTTPLPGWDENIRNVVLKKKMVSYLVTQVVIVFEADQYFRAAPKVIRSTEHFHTGRRGHSERLSSYSGGCYPELRRTQSVMLTAPIFG